MTELKDLNIYIVDNNYNIVKEVEKAFIGVGNVQVIYDDLERFYIDNKETIDCLVSPANAFGRMTGGYDAVLSNILGWDFQYKVQKYIQDNFYGEQPVATSFIIQTELEGLSLIHTPTMRVPSLIEDDLIVYYCMRSTLICALKNNIHDIVIPVFGGSCGGVEPSVAAKMMRNAYEQILYRKGIDYNF